MYSPPYRAPYQIVRSVSSFRRDKRDDISANCRTADEPSALGGATPRSISSRARVAIRRERITAFRSIKSRVRRGRNDVASGMRSGRGRERPPSNLHQESAPSPSWRTRTTPRVFHSPLSPLPARRARSSHFPLHGGAGEQRRGRGEGVAGKPGRVPLSDWLDD